MKARTRKLLLWIWPRVRRIYARYGLELSLRDMHSAPGAHAAHSTPPAEARTRATSAGSVIPGAH